LCNAFLPNRYLNARILETDKMKKKLGRPRKKVGTITGAQFVRAGVVIRLYEKARRVGRKHSSAVVQTTEIIKKRYPEMRISETGVKRILSKFRPNKSEITLTFERSRLTGEELARFESFQQHLAAFREKGLTQPILPEDIPTKAAGIYRIRFIKRPNYPRHNRRTPRLDVP